MGTNLYCPDCDTGIDQDDLLMCPSCSAVRPPFGWPNDPLLKSLVDGGRYEVQHRLGSGGFGVVYEVLHTLVGQSRAMKVMDQKLVGQGDIQRRFIDEWDILDKLDHPHIVRCYEIGILPETRQPFMLLDLIRGCSLFEVIWPTNVAKPRRMDPARAARMGIQIASALAHAHSRDLLHRDLKPDNILLLVNDKGEESVKVIDFGIAKILGKASVDRMTSRVVGTPEYMAPEQFNPGKTLDGRLDLWQLGAVLFFVITGWPPYSIQDEDPLGVYREMLARTGLGPRPSEQYALMRNYPGLDELIGSLLSTDPNLRPDNAIVLEKTLRSLLESELDGVGPAAPSGIMPMAEMPRANSTVLAHAPTAGLSDNDDLKSVGAESVVKLPQSMRRKVRSKAEPATEKTKRATSRRETQNKAQKKAQTRTNTARIPSKDKKDKDEPEESKGKEKGRLWVLISLLTVLVLVLIGALALIIPWDDLIEGEKLQEATLVWIPAGSFEMGSPKEERGRFDNETRHKVTITNPFYIQTTEVTENQWRVVMGNNPSGGNTCGPNCPVVSVSWWDTLEFLNRRSVSEGFEKCYELTNCIGIPGVSYTCKSVDFAGLDCSGYRLPTEAEWEYAARAGSVTPFFNGILTQDKCSPLDPALNDVGWYCGNARARTQIVGQKRPNQWGLFDTAGNVNEWVWDWNFGNYDPVATVDPLGPESGAGRTYRGGTWSSLPADCRVSSRGYTDPTSRKEKLGFRAARTAHITFTF